MRRTLFIVALAVASIGCDDAPADPIDGLLDTEAGLDASVTLDADAPRRIGEQSIELAIAEHRRLDFGASPTMTTWSGTVRQFTSSTGSST